MSDKPDTILIEADTIESALEALTERYGAEATIVSAERVRRGGIAGFFATEVVELVAIPPLSGRHLDETPTDGVIDDTIGRGPGGGVDSAFAQLLDAAERSDIGVAGPSTSVAVLDHPTRGTPAADAAPERLRREAPVEGIRWDVSRLIEIGLPGSLIEDLMLLDPTDDLAHVEQLARSIAPLTGVLPAQPHRMIGTQEGRHTAHVEITDRSRPVHLVLAHGDQLDVTKPPPAIVSWAHDAAAPTAIAVAWQTGATLGWAGSSDGRVRRITPVDAALAVRRLMVAR
ncbi:MAG: hypothetical protein OEQ47_05325 [Acidimicrobiia bacterium]|nr:hypothetical protein [Acidimicrobiia bacterium]